jgi:hypothetical protein
MFTYKLYAQDGDEIGEATYPSMVKPDETLFFGGGREFRVIAIVPLGEESPLTGVLHVEAI